MASECLFHHGPANYFPQFLVFHGGCAFGYQPPVAFFEPAFVEIIDGRSDAGDRWRRNMADEEFYFFDRLLRVGRVEPVENLIFHELKLLHPRRSAYPDRKHAVPEPAGTGLTGDLRAHCFRPESGQVRRNRIDEYSLFH